MPSTSNKLSSNLENNLPDAMNTLAMGLADNAPAPYNAIGMSLVALLWPSSSQLPTTMESIIEEIKSALDNQLINNAEVTANGIQSYIDSLYSSELILNESTYSNRLSQLKKFNDEFFLHIISTATTIEDNTANGPEVESKTLIPLMTWAGWHLACLQEMALMDVIDHPNPQNSKYLQFAKSQAKLYVAKIDTLHKKYFIQPVVSQERGVKHVKYILNGKEFSVSGTKWGNPITGYNYYSPGELKIKAEKAYTTELQKTNFWVSETDKDTAGPLIPKIISSFKKIIKNPLPTSSYGLQRFVCYTKNKTDKAGNIIELYYYGPEDEKDKAPLGYKVNASYYGASFWAWKKRPPIGTVPVYLLQLGDVYWFSKNKETGSGWTFLGVAFYAFITADLDKAKALGIEYVELLCGGYTPKDEYQQYFFTTSNDVKVYPPQFSQPSTSLTGPFYVPTGNDYDF